MGTAIVWSIVLRVGQAALQAAPFLLAGVFIAAIFRLTVRLVLWLVLRLFGLLILNLLDLLVQAQCDLDDGCG